MTQAIEVEEKGRPQRHKVEVALSLHRGDFVDLLVHARSNHDCDGVFLIDVQVHFPSPVKFLSSIHPSSAPRSNKLKNEMEKKARAGVGAVGFCHRLA